MSIIIPSKKLYNIENQKVLHNQVNQVQISVLEETSSKEKMFLPVSQSFLHESNYDDDNNAFKLFELTENVEIYPDTENPSLLIGKLTITYRKIIKKHIKTEGEKKLSKTDGEKLQISTTVSEYFQMMSSSSARNTHFVEKFGQPAVETVKSAIRIEDVYDFDSGAFMASEYVLKRVSANPNMSKEAENVIICYHPSAESSSFFIYLNKKVKDDLNIPLVVTKTVDNNIEKTPVTVTVLKNNRNAYCENPVAHSENAYFTVDFDTEAKPYFYYSYNTDDLQPKPFSMVASKGWDVLDFMLEKEDMVLLEWARKQLGKAKFFINEVKEREIIVSIELPYSFSFSIGDDTLWELVCDVKEIDAATSNEILVNFEGNIGTLKKENEIYGDEGKPYLHKENGFIKIDTKIGGVKLSENLANNIVSDWENGLETARILCSIGEYYNESEVLVISTVDESKNMYFVNNDKVIPYYYTNKGEVPISLYSDGTPKVFKVTGVNFIFNGAMWQELELLEIPK